MIIFGNINLSPDTLIIHGIPGEEMRYIYRSSTFDKYIIFRQTLNPVNLIF